MSFETDYPDLNMLLTDLFESAGSIKLALADGHVTVDEIVGAIPDAGTQQFIHQLLTALQGLPGEMKKVTSAGPWAMLGVAEALMGKVTALFK